MIPTQSVSGKPKSTRTKRAAQECQDPMHRRVRELTEQQRPMVGLALYPTAVAIPLRLLLRHPENRQPSDAQVAALQASILREGQLEPVLVRRLPEEHSHRVYCSVSINQATPPAKGEVYQIISGETRCLALHRCGEAKAICRVIEPCSDGQALELLAVCNAARSDLNAIQKARLLARLVAPVEQHGAGLTHEQAGKIYGLESRGGVANLLRLLTLPKSLADLVEAGHLPQTLAREALPFCVVPALVDKIVAEAFAWGDDVWSRQEFQDELQAWTRLHTRPMKPAGRHAWGWNSERLFAVDDQVLAELRVVSLPGRDGKTEERATNVELWDRLQKQAAEKRDCQAKEKQGKAAAAATAREDGAARTTRTPAEQKQLEKEQDEHLSRRIHRWRHQWLRQLISRSLLQKAPDHWVILKLVLWCLVHRWAFHEQNQLLLDHKLIDLIGGDEDHLVQSLKQKTVTPSVLQKLLTEAIAVEERNPDLPAWPHDLVEQLAIDLQIDLADAWLVAQSLARGGGCPEVASFLQLHNGRQLEALAREWRVPVPPSGGKAALVRQIQAGSRVLPLPKAIASAGKSKGT